MSNLEKREEIKNYLQKKLDELHTEAQNNRTAFNMGQAVGSIGLLSGVIGCLGLPILGLPVAVIGGALYTASTIVETMTTGECTPIPFMSTRFQTMAMRAAQIKLDMDDDDLDLIHYLPKKDRVLYFLILSQDVLLSQLLAETPEIKWNSVINNLITKYSKDATNNNLSLHSDNRTVLAKGIIQKEMKVLNIVVETPLNSNEIKSETSKEQETKIQEIQIEPTLPAYIELDNFEVVKPSLIHFDKPIVYSFENQNPVSKVSLEAPKPSIHYFDFEAITNNGYVESALFIGASRTGKSWAADWYARTLKKKHNKLQTFYCTPVDRVDADESEAHLFDFCESSNLLRFNLLTEINVSVLDRAAEKMLEMLNNFIYLTQNGLTSKSNPAIFIQDELTVIQEKSKISPMMKLYYDSYMSLLVCLSSGGKAIGVGVWGIAPTGSVGGLGLNRHVLSTMKSFYIGTTNMFDLGVYKGALKNNLVCENAPSQSFLWDCKSKGIRTIISYGAGKWEPLFDMNTEELPYGQRKLKKFDSNSIDPLVDELVKYIKSKGFNVDKISVDKVMSTPKAKSTGITESQVKRALELAR